MDTVTLVENRIEEGQRLIDQLEEKGIAIRAACWVKPIDKGRWILYVATPIWDEKGPLDAYRQLTPALRSLGNDWLTSSDVTLVGETNPMVKDARELLRRFPHRSPIQSPLPLLGGIPVEDVFVYPLGKAKATIYGMTFREEPSACRICPLNHTIPRLNSWKSATEGATNILPKLVSTGSWPLQTVQLWNEMSLVNWY